jgi:hypothetical protein
LFHEQEAIMHGLALMLLVLGQIDVSESAEFSKELQVAAVLATVRIVDVSRKAEGSGVIIGRKGPLVYILTARHLVDPASRLEITTFSADSYPNPAKVYRSARIVAQSGDTRDLALLRLTTDDPMPGARTLPPGGLVLTEKGFSVLTVGCSDGKAPTCQVDAVIGKRLVRREGAGKPATFWEVGREEREGRSGGPLLDKRGYLLGVCSGTNKGKSYFCHTDEIRAFLEESGFAWLVPDQTER